MKKEKVYINGYGETSRDFCFIDNTVQMTILAAMTEYESAIDQVYNVALNDRTNLNQLYHLIKEKLVKRVADKNGSYV